MRAQWRGAVDRWLSVHHGVITRRQLEQFGCSSSTVAGLVRRQSLIPLAPGVFRSSQYPAGEVQLMAAVCQRHPGALIAFLNAAKYWKWRRLPSVVGVHALVAHGSSPVIPGVVVHRCRDIAPVDVVELPDGIRLTSPPRTLFDCADLLGASAAASVLEQLLDSGTCTLGTVLGTVTRLARPGRPGSRTMLQVIAAREPWHAALQSDLEHRVLEAIRLAGMPPPVPQYRLQLPTGRTIRLDFAWPDAKVALEIDHPTWHAGAESTHRDKQRDRKAATLGWVVSRITDLDVAHGLGEALRDVALILRGRGMIA